MRTFYSRFSRPLIFGLLFENHRIYEHSPEKYHNEYYERAHLDIMKHGREGRHAEQSRYPAQKKHASKRLIRNDCGTATKLSSWRRQVQSYIRQERRGNGKDKSKCDQANACELRHKHSPLIERIEACDSSDGFGSIGKNGDDLRAAPDA
ncbi:MAG TPA: hypothetical protein VJO13_04855 [Ktedonobacterales bacterium]|nr:hypothetical protein [Ktedonobacterales bacterium]